MPNGEISEFHRERAEREREERRASLDGADAIKGHLIEILNARQDGEIVIDRGDHGSFIYVDVEGQELWEISVRRA